MRRTRAQLRNALVELVLERGWDAVSVTDVCDRADVGRSTFYVHFFDKEDLLLSGFDDLHAQLTSYKGDAAVPFAFAEPLVNHARENLRLYRALIGRKSGQAVQRKFRDTVARMIGSEIVSLGVSDSQRERAARFVTGGFVEMLLAWLDHPARLSPAELAASFRALAVASLGAERRSK